jgi:osmotically-inducible protein OsmY
MSFWYCLLAALLFLSACLHDASPGRDRATLDDETITKLVKRALVNDKANLLEVDVEAHDGAVYLTGEVRDQDRKLQAERIVRDMEFVKEVFNKISLEP